MLKRNELKPNVDYFRIGINIPKVVTDEWFFTNEAESDKFIDTLRKKYNKIYRERGDGIGNTNDVKSFTNKYRARVEET